jgi:DNA (cytosine-5)-methyltransferase 1
VDDHETWIESGITPTLNAFDGGDTRSTVIIVRMRQGKAGGGKGALMSKNKSLTLATGNDQTLFIFYGNRVADTRLQGDVINTLQARMGTGGNNMPMVYKDTVAYLQDQPTAFTQNQRDEIRELGDRVGALSATPGTHQTNYLATTSTVRRLTPTECERLQGFPDDWTAMVSDSSRYKQMGNAITVPVARYVFECLLAGLSDA